MSKPPSPEDCTTVQFSSIEPGQSALSESIPETIGKYKILGIIGEGGMGSVLRAEEQGPLKRVVALKITRHGLNSRQVIQRFEAERQALAVMAHAHIAKVLDAGSTDSGRPYFVMEFVEGAPITAFCDKHRLSLKDRVHLFMKVCEGVQHAHQKGIVHRDLKPSNILVTLREGVAPCPKIIDFGIAKAVGGEKLAEETFVTGFGNLVGTPGYMSPEQAGLGGMDVDLRTDIYSLGVVLYELLTGTTPHQPEKSVSGDYFEVLRLIREVIPNRPSVHLSLAEEDILNSVAEKRATTPHAMVRAIKGDLDWITMKCLQKERERRYESAGALRGDLQRHLDSRPVSAGPESSVYLWRKFFQRHKPLVMVSALAGAILFVSAVASAWQARRTTIANRNLTVALGKLGTLHAISLIESDRAHEALAHLASLAKKGETNFAPTRILFLLAQRRFAVASSQLITHSNAIWSAKFSPDGSKVITASADGTAKIAPVYDDGAPIVSLEHSKNVWYSTFSRDGRYAASASEDNTVKILDLSTNGAPISIDHKTNVYCIDFSTDGRLMATAAADGRVRLWEVTASGFTLMHSFKHEGPVSSAIFSSKGDLLLTACDDGTARLWRTDNFQPMGSEMRHEYKLYSARFNNDCTAVVTASHDRLIKIWNAETTSLLASWTNSLPALWAAFSPDSKSVASASADRYARIFDVATGALRYEFHHGDQVRFVAFHPTEPWIATAADDFSARIFDFDRGHKVIEVVPHRGEVWHVEFSPDGKQFVTSSLDGTARIWRVAGGNDKGWPTGLTQFTELAHFSSEGSELRFARRLNLFRTVNFQTGAESEEETYGISPDGRFEIIESGTRFAVRDRVAAEMVLSFPREKEDRLHFSPCSTLLLVKNGPGVSIYNLKSKKQVYKGNVASSLIEFSAARKSVFFAQSLEGETRFQEVTSEGAVMARPQFKHQSAVTAFCIDEEGRRLCTASRDSVIRMFTFDSNAHSTNRMVAKVSNIGTVNAIKFSPHGKWLLTGSDDGTARMWDVETGYPLSEPFEHVRRVDRVEFSPDQKRIMVAGDGQIRVWQMPPAGVAPEWLPLAAEVVSGFRMVEDGGLVDVPFDDAQKLKVAIAQETQSKDVATWVKAFLPE